MSTFQNGPTNPNRIDEKKASADPVDLSVNKLKLNTQLKGQYTLGLKVEEQFAEIKKLKESFAG